MFGDVWKCFGQAVLGIGWATVGRAEFAYLIAQMALSGNMLDEELANAFNVITANSCVCVLREPEVGVWVTHPWGVSPQPPPQTRGPVCAACVLCVCVRLCV